MSQPIKTRPTFLSEHFITFSDFAMSCGRENPLEDIRREVAYWTQRYKECDQHVQTLEAQFERIKHNYEKSKREQDKAKRYHFAQKAVDYLLLTSDPKFVFAQFCQALESNPSAPIPPLLLKNRPFFDTLIVSRIEGLQGILQTPSKTVQLAVERLAPKFGVNPDSIQLEVV